MRTVSTLAVILALFSCGKEPGAGPAPGAPEAAPAGAPAAQARKYGVKSGIVHYEFGSKMATMTKVFYFDDFGAKECFETSYEGNLTETQFTDGKDRYLIRADNPKVAWNQGQAYYGIAKKITRKEFGGQRDVAELPARSLCGKECEVYAVKAGSQTITFAGWEGVQMLMESDGAMAAFERAVRAEFEVPVPAEKFQVPEGCEVKKP